MAAACLSLPPRSPTRPPSPPRLHLMAAACSSLPPRSPTRASAPAGLAALAGLVALAGLAAFAAVAAVALLRLSDAHTHATFDPRSALTLITSTVIISTVIISTNLTFAILSVTILYVAFEVQVKTEAGETAAAAGELTVGKVTLPLPHARAPCPWPSRVHARFLHVRSLHARC